MSPGEKVSRGRSWRKCVLRRDRQAQMSRGEPGVWDSRKTSGKRTRGRKAVRKEAGGEAGTRSEAPGCVTLSRGSHLD